MVSFDLNFLISDDLFVQRKIEEEKSSESNTYLKTYPKIAKFSHIYATEVAFSSLSLSSPLYL